MSTLPDFNQPLPQSDGPKLHPFPDREASMEFVRVLSDVGSEGQSHVFEVSIGGEAYALKMDRAGLDGEENDVVSVDLLRAHMDPFFNECRAYGRLVEANQNGRIAVRCHGHMSVPAAVEEELARRFGVRTWDRPEEEYARPVPGRQPFRAVVKDLVREPVPWTHKVAKKMLKDLKAMRRLGVYPMDVGARNYEAGLLVDMSIAITTPHYRFDLRPRWQVRVMQREDLLMFDKMIADEKVNTWVRALPNKNFCAKLRSQTRRNRVPV